MFKHTETIRRQRPTNCLSVFDHSVGLVLKGLRENVIYTAASTAGTQFREWVKVGIDVYIPHSKYQVKPLSSSCFSGACAASIT